MQAQTTTTSVEFQTSFDSFLCFLALDKAGLLFGRDFHILGGSEEKVFCPDDQINFCDKRDCYVV